MAKRKRNTNQPNQETQRKEPRPFELRTIKPLTSNQQATFTAYNQGYNLILHGYAGTGKTFISTYLALNDILNDVDTVYEKMYIVRSAVSSRNIGFLPGGPSEKNAPYEEPYNEICDDLFGRGDGYRILKAKGIVDFRPTSFLRGITFRNCVLLVDEIQNMTFQELDTIITRVGENCRIVFCGDFRQTDFNKATTREESGIHSFMKILDRMDGFAHVEFDKEDIVRSGLVKSYIINKTELELTA